ncbi:MAG: Protein FemA [Parcubacteria group bacterium GW2011_GWA2_45_30]|nr:MAG: Protein FemA [Parcubacteria group bacterium GW2011_GWA2_45_30]
MNSFLQSSAWEKFQQGLGRKTWRAEGQLVIQHKLPAGFNYLYTPHPELLTDNLLSGVKKIAQGEKSVFLKIDPARRVQMSDVRRQASNPIQPQKTVILDLTKSEAELLSGMHEKTRYNIRLAERKGSLVEKGGDFEAFWGLLAETAKRDKFSVHSREHYEKLLAARDNDFSNEIFFAKYQNKIIAVVLVNFYKPSQTATYLHGASSSEHREVMAPHLLYWRAIQEAKVRGFKSYDFWGIDEARWPGLTRFKLGFGGEQVEYPASVDIIYRPVLYGLYYLARLFR